MDIAILTTNILNPPLLFFFLGFIATLVKSDLEIPQPIPKLFSLYLLCAIGLQGGVELHEVGFSFYLLLIMAAIICAAIIVPFYTFFLLKRSFGVYNAGAIAASYGSVSAVTFITAITFLKLLAIDYSGFMIAGMALMESPAIVVGILLIQRYAAETEINWARILHDSFFNSAVFLILGSLFIGLIIGNSGYETIRPFFVDNFKGALCLFLLDMGLVSAKRLSSLIKKGAQAIPFAICIPLLNACAAIGVARLLGLTIGDAFLFTCLCASASYIAVPAAMRIVVPEANPSLYIPMAMGITFPFNIFIGLPLYLKMIEFLWRY